MGILSSLGEKPLWPTLAVVLSTYAGVDKLLLAEPSFSPRSAVGVLDSTLSSTDHVGANRVAAPWYSLEDWRRLASSSNSTSNSTSSSSSGGSGSSSAGGHHGHPHESLLILLIWMVFGTALLHLTSLPKFAALQQTVVLFMIGMISALIVAWTGSDALGMYGRSFLMWNHIDPHLLLYALLPPLLAGDAMGIDTNVAKRVMGQCLYLAGPGVLVCTFITALFLWVLPFNWPFLLCMVTGAILCATDPVAVVALLKELGASPQLTVQIQGESLLNDGTAIVLFSLAYKMLSGDAVDSAYVIGFLVKAAIYAVIVGALTGAVFLIWIQDACDHNNHSSSLIQVLLTICCAYTSFFVAEGVFGFSGVLSTVAASLVLAQSMWDSVVDAEAMHTTWHMLEFLGNTIIFLLAGSLVGSEMAQHPLMDYVWLFVIYLFLVVLRFAFLHASRPLLRLLHSQKAAVSSADATVMAWGGLRGAVGLALAIQVNNGRAGGVISSSDASKVLFFTGGIAFLTLVINAMTCPQLVTYLGITNAPVSRLRLMEVVSTNMASNTRKVEGYSELAVKDAVDVVDEITHHIGHLYHKASSSGKRNSRLTKSDSCSNTTQFAQRFQEFRRDHEKDFLDIAQASLDDDPVFTVDELCMVVADSAPNQAMLHAVGASFQRLVRASYIDQLQKGELSVKAGIILLDSLATAMSSEGVLTDYGYLSVSLEPSNESDRPPSRVHHIVDSSVFMITIMLAILGTSLCITLEELYPQGEAVFNALEIVFNVIFTVEVVLMMIDQKCQYFFRVANLFDFLLVLLGWSLMIAMAAASASNSGAAQNAQSIKSIRSLKVLRALRMFRLYPALVRLWMKWKGKKCDMLIGRLLEERLVLMGFIRAHIFAQETLSKYYGAVALKNETEIAYILLCSMEKLYSAAALMKSKQTGDVETVWNSSQVLQGTAILGEELLHFVHDAEQKGVISHREAHTLLHPIVEMIQHSNARRKALMEGFCQTDMFSDAVEPDTSDTAPMLENMADNGYEFHERVSINAADGQEQPEDFTVVSENADADAPASPVVLGAAEGAAEDGASDEATPISSPGASSSGAGKSKASKPGSSTRSSKGGSSKSSGKNKAKSKAKADAKSKAKG
eukprot:TRINITY_DN6613_c2_g1_i1.p1 TRINITY_DN6613_c2_g1~~TRINITY_DN6613_c2_g1_i1.p1  ORF type:complete len:1127 (+),score=184.34 TRINITY_DN6613_c2_g1_i1:243-3623(+)